MERKVAPGLFVLSWTSMNIDGYLHRFKQVRRQAAGRLHPRTGRGLHSQGAPAAHARGKPHSGLRGAGRRSSRRSPARAAAHVRPLPGPCAPGGACAQADRPGGAPRGGQPGGHPRDAAGGPASRQARARVDKPERLPGRWRRTGSARAESPNVLPGCSEVWRLILIVLLPWRTRPRRPGRSRTRSL